MNERKREAIFERSAKIRWGFCFGWLVWFLVVGVLFCFNYLRPHSVSPAFVSSSFPGRNYHEPSSLGAAACGPAALCVLAHSTWTAPRGRERATGRRATTTIKSQKCRPTFVFTVSNFCPRFLGFFVRVTQGQTTVGVFSTKKGIRSAGIEDFFVCVPCVFQYRTIGHVITQSHVPT